MSIARKSLRDVTFKKFLKNVRGGKYEATGVTRKVSVQPMSGSTNTQMYGEKVSKMKLLLAPPSIVFPETTGVCIDVSASEAPDYKIVAVKGYSTHLEMHLEMLPRTKKEEAEDADG